MRTWGTIAIMLMVVAGGSISATTVHSQPASPDRYLPASLGLPHESCFRIEDDGILDFPALLARFAGVPDAAVQLETLGWQDGAYRQFACDSPPSGSAGWIDISVHRFTDAPSATAAIPFFAQARSFGTSLETVPATTPGDSALALTGPAGNGTEYTLYMSTGPLLYRVTGVAPSGSPHRDVDQVMSSLLLLSIAINQQHAAPPPAVAPAPGAYAYDILDLGTGDGNWSCAHHLNNAGQILWLWGIARFPTEVDPLVTDSRLLLIQPGLTIDLTQLGIDYGIGINDEGVVLGSTRGQFFYLPNTTDVKVIPILGERLWLAGISNDGTLIGRIEGNAVLIGDGMVTQLESPPGYDGMRVDAISNNGSIAGSAFIEFDLGIQRASLIVNDEITVLGPAPGAKGSNAADINDVGQLIGHPQREGARAWVMPGRSFLYDHPTRTTFDLGSLPGYANSTAAAINNPGQVVGRAWAPIDQSDQLRRAFIYDHQTRTMTDLNTLIDPSPGWHLTSANDINDSGQIVGCGFINNETHAFLMTPNR